MHLSAVLWCSKLNFNWGFRYFTTTTPFEMRLDHDGSEPLPAGIHMACVVKYNAVAKEVAHEVGGVLIIDLYEFVVDFCKAFPRNPAGGPFADNYTSCAIQYTMVFF